MYPVKNQWVLITGASSGFGKDYAEILAAAGAKLILTARRKEALSGLAADLQSRFGTECLVLPADLSVKEERLRLVETIQKQKIELEVLINNAGYGLFGEFANTDWQKTENMLELDIQALTHLTYLVLKDMQKRRRGYIMLVASVGAYQPSPTYAAYAAAKAYVLNFGEALHYELRNSGIVVSVLSPGVTATEFLSVSGQSPSLYQKIVMMQSRPVAESGLRALFRGTPSYVPGWINKISIASVRLIPRRWQPALVWLLMK